MAKRHRSKGYRKLDALERRLRDWEIVLERNADKYLDTVPSALGRVGALFHGSADGRGTLYVRLDPTNLEVLHELAHILDFRKDPRSWLNPASTVQLGELLREQAAFNRLRNSRSWLRLTLQERLQARAYLEHLGGDPSISLQTGKTINQFSF